MSVNLVAQQSVEISKASYDRREPAKEETVCSAQNSTKRRDLAYFSEGLKNFAPTEGLSISEQIRVELPDASTLKIGTVPPCIQKYDLAELNVSRGAIDDYFFYLDSDSIKQQAEALLRGEEYDPDEASNSYFVRGLCEWFTGSDTEEAAKSYESLVREYADQLKKGHTPDIKDLKTSFHLSGEEITIEQIFKIRDTALAIRDIDYGSSVGTSMFVTFAKKGMMKAMAEKYADSLPSGMGKAFADRFTQLVDKNEVATMQRWNNLEYCNGQIANGLHVFLTNFSAYAYDLFSQSDGNSADFANRVSQLVDRISNSGYYQPESVRGYKKILSDACRMAIQSIS